MKKLLVSLLAILALSIMQLEARTFVLAAGLSNYGDQEHMLPFASEGAINFSNLMKQHTNDVTVMTTSSATKSNFLGKLKQIAAAATEKDRVYVYIATHGCDGAVAMYDALVTYDEIVNILKSSKSPMCLCFIDSCHSGSSTKSVGNKDAAKGVNNVAFMVGCRPDEYSIFGSTTGNGFFTKALLKGLRGKSDANGDKRITVKELFKYVYNDVVHRTTTMHDKNVMMGTGQTMTIQHPQLIAPAKIQEAAVVVW